MRRHKRYRQEWQVLPTVAGALRISDFKKELITAVSMARRTGRESGFFVWFDGEDVRVNQPILGEKNQMRESMVVVCENGGLDDLRHPENTGFYLDSGGLVLAFVQVHPGGRPYSHFPSVADIAFLQRNAHENQKLADWSHGFDFWPNPLMLITTTSGKLSLTQLLADWAKYDFSQQPLFYFAGTFPSFTAAWGRALLQTFTQSFGRLPKTKIIDNDYAAAVIMTGWPNWMLSAARLERFFKAIGIPYLLTDLEGLSKEDFSKFSFWVGY